MRVQALAALLAVLICAGLVAPGSASARTSPNDQAVALVHATYDDLLAMFYRPLNPRDLLQAGWAAIGAAHAPGMPPPGALGDLPNDQQTAFSAFEGRFRKYLAGAHPRHGALGVADVMAGGMVKSLHEQHTNYLSTTGVTDGADGAVPNLGIGLGVRISKHAPWIVTDIASTGPAAGSGLAVGDVILAANDAPMDTAPIGSVVQALSGERDSKTKLTLDRDGRRLELTLTNAPYAFPTMTSRMLSGGAGYVRLDEFDDSSEVLRNGFRLLADFDRRLDELDAGGATALILDLRDNPGGSVVTSDALMGRFLPEDAPTVVRFDERGHQVTGIVDGRMRARQLPLVVLVNGDSASASEDTASTLRESNRALLVGQRTHGALATSSILPLPGNAALQVAMAELVTARAGFRVDESGFPVDVEVPDDRTAADYRAGRDPQLDAAVHAIAQAPAPPAVQTTPSAVTTAQLHTLLAGYCPDPRSLAVDPTPITLSRSSADDFVHPNQLIVQGARDPLALQQTVRARGWLGRHEQAYDVDGEDALGITLDIDVYATAAGAASALAANDFPDLQTAIDSPVQLGDGTVAYQGEWMEVGSTLIAWQRGNAVATLRYYATPGHNRTDIPAALGRLIDQQFDRYPLRVDGLGLAPAAQNAPAAQPSATAPSAATSPAMSGQSQPSAEAAAPHGSASSGSLINPATLGVLLLGLAAVGFMIHMRTRRVG